MATNLADFATNSMKIDYRLVAAVLSVLLMGTLALGRPNISFRRVSLETGTLPSNTLPTTDVRYWAAMLLASTIGTVLGDFVSDGLGLGFAKGAIILVLILASVLCLQRKAYLPSRAYYWIVIVVVRTTGTLLGDFTFQRGRARPRVHDERRPYGTVPGHHSQCVA
jgi:uncharacterized membrane-anchored protein